MEASLKQTKAIRIEMPNLIKLNNSFDSQYPSNTGYDSRGDLEGGGGGGSQIGGDLGAQWEKVRAVTQTRI